MTATPLVVPKAAAQFMADAEDAGFTVRIDSHDSTSVSIWVERGEGKYGRNASLNWHVTNVAGMNSRLGFATSYKAGVRFDFANAQVGYNYPVVNSVRAVRIALGIPTKGDH